MANLIEDEPAFRTRIFKFLLAILRFLVDVSSNDVSSNNASNWLILIDYNAVHRPHALELGLRPSFESFYNQSCYL